MCEGLHWAIRSYHTFDVKYTRKANKEARSIYATYEGDPGKKNTQHKLGNALCVDDSTSPYLGKNRWEEGSHYSQTPTRRCTEARLRGVRKLFLDLA